MAIFLSDDVADSLTPQQLHNQQFQSRQPAPPQHFGTSLLSTLAPSTHALPVPQLPPAPNTPQQFTPPPPSPVMPSPGLFGGLKHIAGNIGGAIGNVASNLGGGLLNNVVEPAASGIASVPGRAWNLIPTAPTSLDRLTPAERAAMAYVPNAQPYETTPAGIHELQYGNAQTNFNPVAEIATQLAGKVPSNPVATTLQRVPLLGPIASARGVGGLVGGVADAATMGGISGLSSGNTDVSDPRFWAQAGQAVGNTLLMKGGFQAQPTWGGAAKAATVGAGANATLAALDQAANGQFNPSEIAKAGATGAIMMGGIPAIRALIGGVAPMLADETGAAKVPGIDRRLQLKPGEAETGARQGQILNLRGNEQLPAVTDPNYYKKVLNVASDAARQVSSQANIIRGQAQNILPAMGRLVKGQDGNWYFKDIAQAPAEAALLGPKPGALATRVLERPGEYTLMAPQQAAASKLGAIEASVKNERDIFGVAPHEIATQEGQQYMHRSAVKPTEAAQATALVTAKSPAADLNQGGGGGSRLAIGKDKTRIFDDPAQAVAQGAVYDHPLAALDQNVAQGLSKATAGHVKSLLEPLSRTSADYVPEGIRTQVQGLRQQITNLKGAGLRLTDRQSAAVDDFLSNPAANLDEFRDTLDGIIVQRGANAGKDIAALQSSLEDAKTQLRTILPEWRKAQDIARQSVGNAPGRAAVPQTLAPALIGRDFPQPVADAVTKFYGRNQPPGAGTQSRSLMVGIRSINSNLIPVKATWDASALLMQQGRMIALHPVTFMKNVAKSIGDMGSDASYAKWLASGEADNAARAGIAVQGHAGTPTEFQFHNWFERIPGLGKVTAAANRQFNSFNTRNRVTIFNDYVDANARIGNVLDARAQEQLAVGLNRLTGVSSSRAGDLEQLMEFAPNFTRSHIETIGKALADGSIEGQVARRELSTFFAVMTAAVGGIAVAQGRDPAEVLNPLDMKSLKTGNVRLNPNFGTVRVGNEDINIFGPYVSLARLAVAAGNDLGHAGMAAASGDTNAALLKTFAVLGEVTGTKGSPVASLATQFVKGSTFIGVDPGSPLNLATQVMPISLSTLITDHARGFSWHDAIMDTISTAIGANANPMTANERLDQKAGTAFSNLSQTQQHDLLAANSDLANLKTSQSSSEAQRAAQVTANITNNQLLADQHLQTGVDNKGNAFTPVMWRDAYHANVNELRIRKDEIYQALGLLSGTDPVLDNYFAAITAASNDVGTPDWNAVDKYTANLSPVDLQHIHDKTGLSLDTPTIRQYKADTKAMEPYWNISDQYAVAYANQVLHISGITDHASLIKAIDDAAIRQFGDTPSLRANLSMLENRVLGRYNTATDVAKKTYLAQHSNLIPMLQQWGYQVPVDIARAYAAGAR